MDAVVVPRAQIQRGKAAVLKLRGQRCVTAHERGGAVGVALGLKNLVGLDRTKLADGPVYRADEIGLCQRPGARAQSTGKKIVKAGVVFDVGIGGFAHIDVVAFHKPRDQAGGCSTPTAAGNPSAKNGERAFGQEVLRQHRDEFRHSNSDGKKRGKKKVQGPCICKGCEL